MKKGSKILAALLGCALLCATVGFAAGCSVEQPHTHTFSRVAAVAPGCTTAGNIQHFKCDGCGKLFADGNGKDELTEAAIVVPAAHKMVLHDADGEHLEVSNGKNEYYQCSVCKQLFGDRAGTETVTLSKKPVPMFTDRTCTSDQDFNGDDVFASTKVGGVHAPITSKQFVLRFFMGFNHDVNALKNYEPVEVHANIHRPDYWQFVLYYRPTERVVQMHLGGLNMNLTAEQTEVFKAQNGLYFLFVCDNDTVHLYTEDLEGEPQFIVDLPSFMAVGDKEFEITRMRIGHFNGYFADEKHAGVIKDATIALDTTDLDAERSNPTVVPPEDDKE